MLKFLRILLRIILAPFILIFSFILFLLEKIFELVAGISIILSAVMGIYGLYCIFDPVYNWSAIPALIAAFLLSPLGMPLVGGVLIVGAGNFRDLLKKI